MIEALTSFLMYHKCMMTVLDLFAGCGGLSLGFQQAGYKISAAIEVDKWAAETYKENFETHRVYEHDLTSVGDSYFKQFRGASVVVGGPPCQGFSISASNRRKLNDARNDLYKEFVKAVDVIGPDAFVVENVKEILNAKLKDGKSLLQDFKSKLENLGYKVSYSIINAKYFGVPQDRIRFFMIGTRKEEFDFSSLPNENLSTEKLITLNEAISDLPKFKDGEKIQEDNVLKYSSKPLNKYQQKMRVGSNNIYNHIPMKHTHRLIERFKHIPIDGDMKNVPTNHSARERGNPTKISYRKYHQNHRRLNPDKPSKTITASFYSSFIHPFQNRNLTVREAARIQSFPDTFVFKGKRTTLSKKLLEKKGIFEDIHLDQFNQVGNAVPPILAKNIARSLKNYL